MTVPVTAPEAVRISPQELNNNPTSADCLPYDHRLLYDRRTGSGVQPTDTRTEAERKASDRL